MTDVELDDRVTALEENGGGSSQNGNNERHFYFYFVRARSILSCSMKGKITINSKNPTKPFH